MSASTTKNKVGRPKKIGERRKARTVTAENSDWELLRTLGGGCFSKGLQKVLAQVRAIGSN